ncbi:hypothetical protein [Flavihumibacter petaseus]|uniref:Collagen-like protein n=1 Tax=Flavihumibacter petaseus NBRC 106054 TaxID=1220578 RepID=A0A0E9N2R8_9BACT|nr:hypothetical protein [Flavihumibacter petaseus]GAO43931.1 hypothetical protein FPE01S_02_10370 [Flavihumibacter petaseus NBRC 106054]
MKKLILKMSGLGLLFLTLTLSSCSKEGDTGPAGPAGPAGPVGPAGPTGETGTANVIYSPWLSVDFNDNGIGEIEAPSLSVDVLNSGTVKVYFNLNDETDPVVFPLPAVINPALFIEEPTADDPYMTLDPIFTEGSITILSNYILTGAPFRYVIIPGGVEEGGRSAVNWNDYNSVKKYLNLKD